MNWSQETTFLEKETNRLVTILALVGLARGPAALPLHPVQNREVLLACVAGFSSIFWFEGFKLLRFRKPAPGR
jgi:hypothetical protein